MLKNKILMVTTAIIALAAVGRVTEIAENGAAVVGLAQAQATTEGSPTPPGAAAQDAEEPTPEDRTGACGPENPTLLAILAEEGAARDERERRVAELEARAAAAETRARIESEHLAEVRAGLESLAAQRVDMQNADLLRMAKMYGNMKPKDAARILAGLDDMAVVGVLDQMSERASAPILASMPSAKAEAVARTIIERRSLPGDIPGTSAED